MRARDVFAIAAWAGTLSGLLEGLLQCLARSYPAILAAHKVSAHVLWVAPAVNLSCFLLAAALLVVLRRARRRLARWEPAIVYGLFALVGLFLALESLEILHWLSALLLALGLATELGRRLSAADGRLTDALRRRIAWCPVLIGVVLLGVVGYERSRETWLARQMAPAPGNPTNVLLIVLDTVRYDRFADGVRSSLTPHLDRIGASGVTFDNAWSTTSWSLPSQASILTGRYPHEHGADWPGLELSGKYPTLSKFFWRHGYATGVFSGNAAWVTPEYLGRGVLRFEVYRLEDLVRRTAIGRALDRPLVALGYHSAGLGRKAPAVSRDLLKFLDDYRDRPFFVYLCYMDVNQAFNHRRLNRTLWQRPASTAEVMEAYDQGLTRLDSEIGRLLAALDRRGVLTNTLLIVTSDHGESFGQNEADDHDPPGHGTSLYPEQVRVPLFLTYPGRSPAQQRRVVTQPVSIRQIPATVTHVLGLRDAPFPGPPLPIDQGEPLLASLNYDERKIRLLIRDHRVFIHNLSRPAGSEELYDLASDPRARHDLVIKDPDVPSLRAMLQRLLSLDLNKNAAAESRVPR